MKLNGAIRWSEKDPMTAALVVINYSGGKQSTSLLRQLLDGVFHTEGRPVYVINADPGMENEHTYQHVYLMARECARQGIYFETVPGPNLLTDVLTLRDRKATRLDNAAWFTRSKKGKIGKLIQKCTGYYKIAPMDRAIRKIMERDFDIPVRSSSIPEGFVEKWIGFTTDEAHRIKPPAQKYMCFRYPLIEAGQTKADATKYLADHNYPIPPRSVCNACFANGLATLKDMHDDRPGDWEDAVAVDKAIRDLTQIGVRDPVYVNNSARPLYRLAMEGFGAGDDTVDTCDSGYCFL